MRKMSFNYYKAPSHAEIYNKFRPSPPQELVQKIVDYLSEKVSPPLEEAIDVGCGGGQSTEILASYFKKVQGFDPSESQVSEALKKNKFNNITYRVGNAESIDCQNSSLHLVTACQACHWFDLPKFYAEVERVLIPGGVLAMYGYHLPRPQYKEKNEDLAEIVKKYYCETLGDYVLPESKMVYLENYLRDKFNKVPFITEPIIRDEFTTTLTSTNVCDLVGYVSSWSGFQNFRRQVGEDKANKMLNSFEKEIMDAIGCDTSPKETQLQIEYKYFLNMGRKPIH